MKAIVIGSGMTGLLTSLTLRAGGHEVILLSRSGMTTPVTPFILPEMVLGFLERVIPGINKRLIDNGALSFDHGKLLEMKFPGKKNSGLNGHFLFLGRGLLFSQLLRSVRESGVEEVEAEVTGLIMDGKRVTGVITASGKVEGDNVFDCTGTPDSRKRWLEDAGYLPDEFLYSSVTETVYQRLYQADTPVSLNLRSTPGCRGGIYPIEKNQFILSLSFPEGKDPGMSQIQEFGRKFTEFLHAGKISENSSALGEWMKLEVKTGRSDYYEKSSERPDHFYPVGDGVILSNPLYGRGLALFVLQLRNLLDSADIKASLKAGHEEAVIKWSEIAESKDGFPVRLGKKLVMILLEKEHRCYLHYLDFYQLRISPSELLFKLLLTPLAMTWLFAAGLFCGVGIFLSFR